MPDHIILTTSYKLKGRIRNPAGDYEVAVTTPLPHPVRLKLTPELDLTATWECDISEALAGELRSGLTAADKLSKPTFEEAVVIHNTINKVVRRWVHAVKYYANEECLREVYDEPFGGRKYSFDGQEWSVFPFGIAFGDARFRQLPGLNDDGRTGFADFVNSGDELLAIAMKHLHRAKVEADYRHAWIDATIAAELAIKEFLIRTQPKLETLLLEVPSPPLPKMYGSILQSFAGVESPVKKELAKGAEIRNKLVHRPQGQEISHGEASDYIMAVETGIYHLLTLLRPNDSYLKLAYEYALRNHKGAPGMVVITKNK